MLARCTAYSKLLPFHKMRPCSAGQRSSVYEPRECCGLRPSRHEAPDSPAEQAPSRHGTHAAGVRYATSACHGRCAPHYSSTCLPCGTRCAVRGTPLPLRVTSLHTVCHLRAAAALARSRAPYACHILCKASVLLFVFAALWSVPASICSRVTPCGHVLRSTRSGCAFTWTLRQYIFTIHV